MATPTDVELSPLKRTRTSLKLHTENGLPPAARPTNALISEQRVRLKLLELFHMWNSDGTNELDMPEVVLGLRLAGIRADPNLLTRMIFEVSKETSHDGKFTTDMTTLSNDEFVRLMGRPEMLGGRPFGDQLSAIDAMQKGILQVGLKDRIARLRKRAHSKLETTRRQLDGALLETQSLQEKKRAQPGAVRGSVENLYSMKDAEKYLEGVKCCGVLLPCNGFWRWVADSPKAQLVFLFLVWWVGGAVLYMVVDGWSFVNAFYYAIQAGFSIGYGSLSETVNGGWNQFETCVDGDSVRGVAPNASRLFAQLLATDEYREAIAGHAGIPRSHLCAYLYSDNPGKLASMSYTIVHICVGAVLISAILSIVAMNSIEQSEKWYNEEKDHDELDAVRTKYRGRPVLIAWVRAKIWMGDNWDLVMAWVLLVSWGLAGAAIFAALEGTDYSVGLYFAVSAASTAGLLGPSPNNQQSLVFVMFYSLVGVPLYANGLGTLSNALTAGYIRDKADDKRYAGVTESEYNYMCRLGDQDGKIDKFEFAMLWCLRNGLCNPSHLKELVDDFEDLDVDGNGIFSRSEMQASCAFEACDRNHDGQLSAEECVAIAHKLQSQPSAEFPGKFLLDPAQKYTVERVQAVMRKFDAQPIVVVEKRVKMRTAKAVRIKKWGRKKQVMQTKTVQANILSLNRREFMRWWWSEFKEYTKDAEQSVLSEGTIQIQTLLDAIAEDEEAEEGSVVLTASLGKETKS
eukprot:g5168.t1